MDKQQDVQKPKAGPSLYASVRWKSSYIMYRRGDLPGPPDPFSHSRPTKVEKVEAIGGRRER